ncbi:MAG TPA: glycosyl hydrolase family 28-related protein, partial [Pyrinomonadaceae bacterium]|nr:glycosyl hydrolase family 28-related protein [Pyrinomonadaceae bacterium]
MTKYAVLTAVVVCLLAGFALGQNRFEGHNIILDVPTTQRAAACAIRYAPPTTQITITDLDRATPMKVAACGGTQTSLTAASGGSATMRANPSDFKWCFQGEDKRYRISFAGDQYSGPISYDWVADSSVGSTGAYNVKDFGALGNGRADDTIAIQSALAFLASRNGGILHFPEGDYPVGGITNFKGITVPSGVTIQGVAGLHTGAATNNVVKKNASRITLNGPDRALFKLGECTEKVAFKDIELLGSSQQNTIGIEGVGAYNSTQDLAIENVAFSTFWRGIYVHGLPQTNLNWQFDYVHIDRCRFVFNTDAGIYTNIRNSDWRVQNSLFINPRRTSTQKADSMVFERVAGVLIDNTVGGGFVNA